MTYNPDHVFETLDNLSGMLQELLSHNQPGYINRLNFLWSMWSFQTFTDREFEQVVALLGELRASLDKEGNIARDGGTRESAQGGSSPQTPENHNGQSDEPGLQFSPDSPGDYRGPY